MADSVPDISHAASESQDFWLKSARRVARRINTAWWLQILGPAMLITSLIAACALLLLRRQWDPLPSTWILMTSIAIFFLISLICWLIARRDFYQLDAALVRIESNMGLCNALTSAKDGISPWPAKAERIDDGLKWNWPRIASPLVAALAFLGAGYFLPVGAKMAPGQDPQQPKAWQELQAEITQLDEQETVEEDYLEEIQKRLDELKAQEKDAWFSHSSLEATDSLKGAHKNEVARLERELLKAVKALDGLGNKNSNQAARDRMMADLDQAIQGLQAGAMKPNSELLKQLQKAGGRKLEQLTPEQIDQLRKKMRQNAQQLAQSMGGSGKKGDWLDKLMAQNEKGPG